MRNWRQIDLRVMQKFDLFRWLMTKKTCRPTGMRMSQTMTFNNHALSALVKVSKLSKVEQLVPLRPCMDCLTDKITGKSCSAYIVRKW